MRLLSNFFKLMGKLLEGLINYLENTPKEVLEEEFKQLEPYTKIGPTVDEYIKMMEEARKCDIIILDYPDIIDSSKPLNPEFNKLIDKYFWDLV